jgi:hypothetical protein
MRSLEVSRRVVVPPQQRDVFDQTYSSPPRSLTSAAASGETTMLMSRSLPLRLE